MAKLRVRMPKPTRSVLFVIAGMLLASGMIRLGGETGQAVAREVQQIAASTKSEPEQVAKGAPDVLALLEAIERREGRIADLESAVARDREAVENRAQALAVAEKRIEERLAQLVAAEKALAATIAKVDAASEGDLERLTAVYENMKPKDAAALFEEMNPDFAAGFLGRMRADAAGAIMAGLQPTTAYTISVVLAGRNADQSLAEQ